MRLQTKLSILIVIILILGFGALGLLILWHESRLLHDKIRHESEILSLTLVASIKNIMLSKAGSDGHEKMMSNRERLKNEMYERLQNLIKEVGQTEVKSGDIHPAIGVPFDKLVKGKEVDQAPKSGALLKKVQLFDRFGNLKIQSGSLSEELVPIQLGKVIETGKRTAFYEKNSKEQLHTHLEPLLNETPCQACHGTDHNVRGVVSVSLSISEGMSDIRRNQLYLLILALAFTLITILTLRFSTKRLVIEPISKLASGMKEVEAGNLGKRVDIKSQDEIGDISRGFNSMTESLQWSREAEMKAYLETLEALARAIDLRHADTEAHSKRVAKYSVRLAKEMGIDGEKLKDINVGALLHDIGKIGVPDHILLKPGRLTDEERKEMEQHPLYGYRMIGEISFLSGAKSIVLYHHERYDGSGYPNGLIRDNIPIGARIFAISDTFDAITSDRPYRKGSSYEVAIAEIIKGIGTQFDPDIVSTFLKVSKIELETLRKEAEAKMGG